MNKKVSKTLAAVLSAAMAASAFAVSTGAAFAASTGSGVDSVEVTPVNVAVTTATGVNSKNYYKLPNVNTCKAQFEVTIDGQTYTPTTVSAIRSYEWVSSNTEIATVDGDKVTVVNGNVSDRQMVSFTRKVKLTMANQEVGSHDKKGDLTAEATLQIDLYVYPNGGYAVLPLANASSDPAIENTYTISVNEQADFNTYKIGTDSRTGKAKFTFCNDKDFGLNYASSVSGIPVDAEGFVKPQDPENVTTGSATISATSSKIASEGQYIVPAQVKVENTFAVEGPSVTTVEKKYNTNTATYLVSNVKASRGKAYDVTGMDLILKDSAYTISGLVLTNDSVVGNITDEAPDTNNVYVEGTAGDIEANNIYVDTLHTQSEFPTATTTGVALTADTNKSSVEDSKASAVVTGDLTATKVEVEGTTAQSKGAYQPTTVGNIDATTIKLTSTEKQENGAWNAQGAVETGDISIDRNGTLTLDAGEHASAVTVDAISGFQGRFADCPYSAKLIVNKGSFKLGDLTAIGEVTIGNSDSVKADVTVGAIDTGTYDNKNNNGPCNLTSNSQIKVAAQSKLTADSIRTSYVDPNSKGTFVVPVNSFEIFTQDGYKQPQVTGATLSVPDAKEGDILYTTAGEWGKLPNLFKTPNATLVAAEDVGKNVWTYSVGKAELRGIQVDKTTLEVGKEAQTLTLTTVPSSVMALPEGVTVKWDTTKDSVKLTPSADGMSCKVEAVGYTENNINDSNHATVTATLIDENGDIYDEFGTAASSTKTEVTLTDKAPEAEPFTVKVTDLNGHTTTCAADGSTVIEVPQSTSFRVEMTSGTSFPESQLDYHAANGDVAGTNTISAWNGTSGVYEVYAAGGVGEQASMWANGQRIFQIRVTSRPFTSDTTMDFDLKVGNTYTFAINPNNKNASFTFNTANGDALQTSIVKGAYPDANGIYYCKVKATQAAGKIGVYCTLDGVLYKVFTVNTIA